MLLLALRVVAAVARGRCRRPWSLPSPVLSHGVAATAPGCWHRVLLLASPVVASIVCCYWRPWSLVVAVIIRGCYHRPWSLESRVIAAIVNVRWHRV